MITAERANPLPRVTPLGRARSCAGPVPAGMWSTSADDGDCLIWWRTATLGCRPLLCGCVFGVSRNYRAFFADGSQLVGVVRIAITSTLAPALAARSSSATALDAVRIMNT
jgi:hypothetical protein